MGEGVDAEVAARSSRACLDIKQYVSPGAEPVVREFEDMT